MGNSKLYTKAVVRLKVREVCAMAAGEPKSEAMLLMLVNELLGTRDGVDIQMLRDALLWNLEEDFLSYQDESETVSGEKEWLITRKGRNEEGIK